MIKTNDNSTPWSGKAVLRLRLLSVFCICFAVGCASFARPSAAALSGAPPQPPAAAPAKQSTATKAAGEPSPLWVTDIWRALPLKGLSHKERTVLIKAYQENHWRPFFINAQLQTTARTQTLLRALDAMSKQGLDPEPYHLQELHQQMADLQNLQPVLSASGSSPQILQAKLDTSPSNQPTGRDPAGTASPDPAASKQVQQNYRKALRAASTLDTRLAICLIRYAREMSPFSTQDQIQALLGKIPLQEFLRQLIPVSPHYAPLCQALSKYRCLAREQEFFTLPEQTLRAGDKGQAVRLLQQRLQQESYYSGAITGKFDRATIEAVKDFQQTHMLTVDGVVGAHTLARLNVPYQKQAELIAISLRLLRDSHTRLFQRFVWVNIPQFELEYYQNNQLQSVHRVIVGRAGGPRKQIDGRPMTVNQTPTMVSSINEVVINPRWYVSDRIRLELNKDVAKDPNYFTSNGYVEMSSTYPWGAPRLFQRPGPTNPLGRVKFEFPNPYAIYLHDTPSKKYFRKPRRDLSHGCIRMSEALIFAKRLLEDDHNSAAQHMPDYLQSEKQIFVRLHHPVPIIIDYVPVSTDQKGQIVFCGDPYGWYKPAPPTAATDMASSR